MTNGTYGTAFDLLDETTQVELFVRGTRLTNTETAQFFIDNVATVFYTDAIKIVEEKNYYPFGLEHKGYNNTINGREHPYGYIGKEKNNELGLQWLDFGARNYDASIGRWMNIDPLAEQMKKHSPYNYAFNSPLYFVDSDGLSPRKGQLANKKEAINEANKAIDGVTNYKTQLTYLTTHFHKNRRFKYEEKTGDFKERDASQNTVRYVYTKNKGWIDLHHFFRFADYAQKYGDNVALNIAEPSEILQGGNSKYSYEDLSSDLAGIDFWQKHGEDIKNGTVSIVDAFDKYLEGLNTTEPEEAPNYEFIPYFDDGKEPKNDALGYDLKGEELRDKHKKSYNTRSRKEKERIKAFNKFIQTLKNQMKKMNKL